MENGKTNSNSKGKIAKNAGKRTPDITEMIIEAKKMIGVNIGKIQKRANLTNPQFYELLFGTGTSDDEKAKSTAIARMKRGEINLDKVIRVALKTNTPIAELFTGIDEKNKDTPPTAYDVCRTFYNILASGRFNIEGTSKLQKEKKVKPFEEEKPELDKYYDFPCMGPDGPEKFDDYPQPVYIRIMPRYFLKGDNVIEYKDTDETFNFLKGALELYSCDLPEESKFHYIRSELEKVGKEPINENDFYIIGEYDGGPLAIPDFHKPW